MRVHRFQPRYRGMGWSAVGIGGGVAGLSLAAGVIALPIVAGIVGMAAGLLYLGSPTWKLEVVTDDDGLEVRSPKATKFRLAWRDIKRVVASPTTNSAFVDGGAPERSLLVPGDGAPAPYQISDASALVATLIERVAPDRVEIVESLDRVAPASKPA